MVMLQAASWEFHFRAHLRELARLRSIRQADWSARRALQIGDAAGIPVHWAIHDDTVTALIGHDDETWHIAFLMPVETIDRLAAEAAELLPESDPPTPHSGQLPGTAATVPQASTPARPGTCRSSPS
ncbi:hypothetical protein CA850_29405 [Micromonospora echinospora]|uniref:Uncharacterized protein n=2 Tax=Micromonospora echinospora TaxID=1877 RepID=A0A1C4VHH7_MICEC|nr:hypothetical protein CA850_29405 [Micromonospora echinospora]SCE83408.1 hypothetical protein GA0070618_1266 [Micromonospora echinospora]